MKIKAKTIPLIIAIAIMLIGFGSIISAFYVRVKHAYDNGKYYSEDDKTANVNVMLTRPDNWEKIESGKIEFNANNFSGIDGSTATIPITAELARQFCNVSDDNIKSYVNHNTTHCAYINLINSASNNWADEGEHLNTQIIFVTEPSTDELKYAEENGITLEVTPVALDGFVFITHKDNPVDSLTVEQVQGIYSGEITNWKELGGKDAEIIPYQRNRNSGSQTAMEQLVMKNKKLMEPKIGYRIESGMASLIEHVGEYQNRYESIGYTYLYYTNNLYKSDDIKVLKIDGVYPSNENLINNSYPFTTAYYEVITDKASQPYRELYDYLLTDEGQRIIELAGYCPALTSVEGGE